MVRMPLTGTGRCAMIPFILGSLYQGRLAWPVKGEGSSCAEGGERDRFRRGGGEGKPKVVSPLFYYVIHL